MLISPPAPNLASTHSSFYPLGFNVNVISADRPFLITCPSMSPIHSLTQRLPRIFIVLYSVDNTYSFSFKMIALLQYLELCSGWSCYIPAPGTQW